MSEKVGYISSIESTDQSHSSQVSEESPILHLSFEQKRLWLFDQLFPRSAAYNIASSLHVKGFLQFDAFQSALQSIVDRHEILRTVFWNREGEPEQHILPELRLPILVENVIRQPSVSPVEQLKETFKGLCTKPFSLEEGPLIRTYLFRFSPDEHVFLLVVHHIIFDGWSSHVFYSELAAGYRAIIEGNTPPLEELPIQYADYALWQQDLIELGILDQELQYWRAQLAGSNPQLLSPDFTEGRSRTPVRGKVQMLLPESAITRLLHIGQNEQCTPFMTLLSLLNVLIYRYTGNEDQVLGTPFSNRVQSETEKLIGFFVNTLVLRTDLTGNPTFRAVLKRVREMIRASFDHHQVPLEMLVDDLRVQRDIRQTPLFQVMISLEEVWNDRYELNGLQSTPVPIEYETSKLDLNVAFIREHNGSMSVAFVYNKELYRESTFQTLARLLAQLLEAVIEFPDEPISCIPFTTAEEKHRLIADWSGIATDYPKDRRVEELVFEQIKTHPRKTAIVHNDVEISYRELDELSLPIARFLQRSGCGKGDRVGLMMDRSIPMILSMLAAWRVGASYVPLDPGLPEQRIRFLIEDAGLKTVVAGQAFAGQFNWPQHVIVGVAESVICEPGYPLEKSRPEPADREALVLYTSGSTGQPKGVSLTHRAIVRLARNTDYIDLSSEEVVGHTANVSFDGSTFEIWATLLNGAQLVIFDREILLSPGSLRRQLIERNVSTLFLTTALFHVMADAEPGAFSGVKQLFVGGESLDPNWIRAVMSGSPPARLINAYGPTETTTWVTWYPVQAGDSDRKNIPIGRPMSNNRVYILDERLHPVPVGIPGEIFIGGDGVALGYINQPDLTRTRFVEDPFSPDRGYRMYRTGDMGRWLEDGNIEFLGRRDYQVKIRGHRIELDEIENTIVQYEQVKESIVLVKGETSVEKSLIAFVTLKGNGKNQNPDLTAHLKQRLPGYMVPSQFIVLESFPLTNNGKIDRKALLDEVGTIEVPKVISEPSTEVERALVAVWEKTFKYAPIGIDDDFILLGGNSLLAVRLCIEIQRSTRKHVTISTLFQHRTIRQLAQLLDEDIVPDSNIIIPIQPNGTRPPIYVFHGVGGNVWEYNQFGTELGPDQPIFGIEGQGMDGRPITDSSVEEMGGRYARAILDHHPEGPYFFAGFCYGGLVAYEVAQQLRRMGKDVRLLALIETYPPIETILPETGPKKGRYRAFLNKLWMLGLRNGAREILLSIQVRLKVRVVYSFRRFYSWSHTHERLLPHRLRRYYIQDIYTPLIDRYRPQPYGGRVLLFRASEMINGNPDIGWGNLLTGSVTVLDLKGSHFLLQEESFYTLCDELKRSIDEVVPKKR